MHLAASIGASLIIGWFCTVITDLASHKGMRWLALSVIAFFFSILTGFGIIIQQDYVQSWRSQQLQWTHLLPLIPDAGENTFIFVVSDRLPKTLYIQTHTSFTARLMEQLFQFPSEWDAPPRVVFFERDWGDAFTWTDTGLEWTADQTLSTMYQISDDNIILIKVTGDHWQRQQGTITIQGHSLHLKPLPPSTMKSSPYNTLPLYDLLIMP